MKKKPQPRVKSKKPDRVYGCQIPGDLLEQIPLLNLVPCVFHPLLMKFPRGFLMFIGYCFAGGLATVADVGIFWAWYHWLEMPYQWGVALGYATGMITNFTISKYLVFGNKSKELLHQFGTFCVVAMIGLGLTYLLVVTQVEVFKLEPVIAKIIAVPLVLIWNFFGNTRATFKWFK